jgi:tape measure domain-containing protein
MSTEAFNLTGTVGVNPSQALQGLSAVEKGAEKTASTLERIGTSFGKKLSGAIAIGLGDVGKAVDALVNITESGLRGIPVVGGAIAATFHEVSGVLQDATARGFAYNDVLKEQKIQLDLVTGSAEETKRELTEIGQIAFKTNVGRSFLVDAVQDLQLFNVDAQKALDLVRGLSNQATATGGGEGRVLALTDLIERVLETGKLDTRAVRQLIRQKIPVYDIIADELKVSKQRAKQLINSGALSGEDLITVFTSEFNKEKWSRAAEEMTQTVDGMTGRYTSAVNKLLGVATKPAYDTSVKALNEAVGAVRGPQAGQIAAGAQSAIKPVTSLVEQVGSALKSGDIFGGALKLGEDVKAGLQKGLVNAGLDAAKGFIGEFREGIGAHSPATEFVPIGEDTAKGWKIGFAAEMQTGGGLMGLFQQTGRRGGLGAGAWTQKQLEFAQKILAIAKEVGATEKQIQAAFAASNVESRFNTLVEGDRDGRGRPRAFGPFQMWPSKGWGTKEQTLDPDYAIRKFFEVAARQSQAGTPGQLAQRVEGSAYPRRYDEQFGTAARLLSAVRGGEVVPTRDDELSAAVRDLAASTNWRTRGDKSPDEGRGRFQDLDPGDQLRVLQGLAGYKGAVGGDLTGGVGRFAEQSTPLPGVASRSFDNSMLQPAQAFSDIGGAGTSAADSWRKLNVLISEDIADLQKVGDTTESVGERSEAAMEKLRGKVHGLGQDFRDLGFTTENMSGIFESSFEDAFAHTSEGWRSMLGTFVLDFAQAVEQMVAKALAAKLATALFGEGTPGGKSGWLSALFNIAGAALGASVGGSNIPTPSKAGGPGGINWLLGHAAGTSSAPPGLAWVGERGPELMSFKGGERVYNNADSMKMAGGGPVVINFHISTPTGQIPHETQSQIARRTQRALEAARSSSF